jgi:hypothetical protein
MDSLGGKFNLKNSEEIIIFLAEAAAQVNRRSSANEDCGFQYRPPPNVRAVRNRLLVKEIQVPLIALFFTGR